MKNFRCLLVIVFIPISIGCGFSPAYQKESDAKKFLEQIYFSEPTGELEFLFLSAIEGKIQNQGSSKYLVSYTVIVSGYAISSTRVNINGRVNFTVTDVSSNTIVFDGSVSNFVGYFPTESNSFIARDDAFKRLMNILADSVRIRLILLGNNIAF